MIFASTFYSQFLDQNLQTRIDTNPFKDKKNKT